MTRVQIAVTVLLLQLPDLNARIVGLADVDRDLVDGVAVKVAGRQFKIVLRHVSGPEFPGPRIGGDPAANRVLLLHSVAGIAEVQRRVIILVVLVVGECNAISLKFR